MGRSVGLAAQSMLMRQGAQEVTGINHPSIYSDAVDEFLIETAILLLPDNRNEVL